MSISKPPPMNRSISAYTGESGKREVGKEEGKSSGNDENKGQNMLSSPDTMRRVKSSPAIPRRGTALLVEDSSIQRKTEKFLIEKAGYQCDTASTLREAITKLKQHNYDRLVSDHNLNCEEAGTPPEVEFNRNLQALLFPHGLPVGAAEGILLLEYIKNQLARETDRTSTVAPKPILVSAVEGVEEDNLRQYANERDAHFIRKPFMLPQIKAAFDNPFTATATPPGQPPRLTTATEVSTPTVTTTTSSSGTGAGTPVAKRKHTEDSHTLAGEDSTKIRFALHDSTKPGAHDSNSNSDDEAGTLITPRSVLANPFRSLTLSRQETTPGAEILIVDPAPKSHPSDTDEGNEAGATTEAGENQTTQSKPARTFEETSPTTENSA